MNHLVLALALLGPFILLAVFAAWSYFAKSGPRGPQGGAA